MTTLPKQRSYPWKQIRVAKLSD